MFTNDLIISIVEYNNINSILETDYIRVKNKIDTIFLDCSADININQVRVTDFSMYHL